MRIPDLDSITQKILELIEENIEPEVTVVADAALINELEFDSLHIIELGFSIQETFDFEFSDKNAFEELDRALGGGRILFEGKLTELGRKLMRERMPELAEVSLPDDLTVSDIQGFYTVGTFARLVHEFYEAAPTVCPETGEAVVINDFRVQTQSGGEVSLPTGDMLVDKWVQETTERLSANA